MFLLHERTRKSLCRTGFVLLCLIPTAAMLSWTSSRAGLSHTAAVQQELSAVFGLRATVARVVYPRPGITRLEAVELFDPESRQSIASADTIELREGDEFDLIIATRPKVQLQHAPLIWRAVNEQIRRRAGHDAKPIRFASTELSLASAYATYAMIDVQGRVDAGEALQGAALSFRPVGSLKTSEPVRVRLTRSRATDDSKNSQTSTGRASGTPSTTGFELHTASAAIPCALFNHTEFNLSGLGPNSTFAGSVWATEAAHGWQGKIAGTVSGIDLRLAISERFAHRLSGPAQIDLQSAEFRRGRLEHAHGTMLAGPGFVSESLLTSAEQSLGLQRRIEANPQGDDLRYDMLAIEFAIDESGLSLKGRCPSDQPGTVLAVQDRAMLTEPVGSSGPVVQLLRMLIPDSAVLVPATRETESLLKFLPIPPVVRQ